MIHNHANKECKKNMFCKQPFPHIQTVNEAELWECNLCPCTCTPAKEAEEKQSEPLERCKGMSPCNAPLGGCIIHSSSPLPIEREEQTFESKVFAIIRAADEGNDKLYGHLGADLVRYFHSLLSTAAKEKEGAVISKLLK